MAKYILFEGTEGVGKTTQTELVAKKLREMGFKVLMVKEPGTSIKPITNEIRKIILDAQYYEDIQGWAREHLLLAVRSITLKKVVLPAMGEYDFIIQDRGILSGLSYGLAEGMNLEQLVLMNNNLVAETFENKKNIYDLYDKVVYLSSGDASSFLEVAQGAKQEFENGDSMEMKGGAFMEEVDKNFEKISHLFFEKFHEIPVRLGKHRKSIDELSDEIMKIILK